MSKVVSESLFIAFEKQDQVSFTKTQERDMLDRFIKKTCKDQKLHILNKIQVFTI